MARYKTKWNSDVYNKMIKEGYGQGKGSEYKPWITVYDFPSTGKVGRFWGKKTDRIHHVLSKNERAMLYFFEWEENVLDIREQFPLLSVNETINISEELYVKHPVDTLSGIARVMTTDFLVTRLIQEKETMFAYAIKPLQELKKQRVLDKLKIEEIYWSKKNVCWQLITDADIDWVKYSNIKFFFEAYNIENLIKIMDIDQMKKIIYEVIQSTPDESVVKSAIELDRLYNAEQGDFLVLIKNLIAHKYLIFDVAKPFSNSTKLKELTINKEK